MKNNDNRVIFHIDVNSAYLSWTAVHMLQQGSTLDIREIPSIVGGDPVTRHGIVLAKSIPAKKFKIQTGETVYRALEKCPELYIVPPKYDLYMKCSNAMVEIFKEYTPTIQRFSVDECFLDFTNMEHLYPDYIELANTIKNRIRDELGFTVSIGISNNKLLAKVASDIKKPDAVITLFPIEIKDKMWPLPVEDLFMVGRATLPKLHNLNIFTIGDLANCDLKLLKEKLKSHGQMIWNYANGIEFSDVRKSNHIDMKGIGNSTTIPFDVTRRDEAHKVILSLCETVGMRLRDSGNCCSLVSVHIRTNEFFNQGRQRKVYFYTDSTKKIAQLACELFDEIWKGEPLRHIGVRVSELCTNEFCQLTLFEEKDNAKNSALDKAVDSIRLRFGSKSVIRCTFLNSGIRPLTGGVQEDDYQLMSSIL
ncbi:DNA polymerase IV [Clostridium swellfunianum]|uniref:DNA polymerase Y family protein n=1 Tax=Clostridium swellfunianum TaxID=1367462 RepID=UPI00202EA13D|nr:DNA polymerase IV [Clostridium swellfunianum]MCM0648602.1 DNA polymerase IV [Clostridium swellfunianum]